MLLLKKYSLLLRVIFAVCVLFMVVLVNYQLIMAQRDKDKPVTISYGKQRNIAANVPPEQQENVSGQLQIEYQSKGTKDYIVYKVPSLFFNENRSRDTCVIGLYISETNVVTNELDLEQPTILLFDKKVCAIDAAPFYGSYREVLSTTLDIERNRYLYPYDYITFAQDISFFGYDKSDNPEGLDSSITADIRFIARDVSSPSEIIDDRRSLKARLPVYASRPILYRALTIIFSVVITVFISALWFIEDLSTLAQIVLGTLLSLWSIRQIVAPTDIPYLTVLDVIFLGLYMYLMIVAILQIPRILLRRNHKPSK